MTNIESHDIPCMKDPAIYHKKRTIAIINKYLGESQLGMRKENEIGNAIYVLRTIGDRIL